MRQKIIFILLLVGFVYSVQCPCIAEEACGSTTEILSIQTGDLAQKLSEALFQAEFCVQIWNDPVEEQIDLATPYSVFHFEETGITRETAVHMLQKSGLTCGMLLTDEEIAGQEKGCKGSVSGDYLNLLRYMGQQGQPYLVIWCGEHLYLVSKQERFVLENDEECSSYEEQFAQMSFAEICAEIEAQFGEELEAVSVFEGLGQEELAQEILQADPSFENDFDCLQTAQMEENGKSLSLYTEEIPESVMSGFFENEPEKTIGWLVSDEERSAYTRFDSRFDYHNVRYGNPYTVYVFEDDETVGQEYHVPLLTVYPNGEEFQMLGGDFCSAGYTEAEAFNFSAALPHTVYLQEAKELLDENSCYVFVRCGYGYYLVGEGRVYCIYRDAAETTSAEKSLMQMTGADVRKTIEEKTGVTLQTATITEAMPEQNHLVEKLYEQVNAAETAEDFQSTAIPDDAEETAAVMQSDAAQEGENRAPMRVLAVVIVIVAAAVGVGFALKKKKRHRLK